MKKLILAATSLAIFAVSAFTFGGDDAPITVKAKFASLYPNVSKVKWVKEDTNYEAEFDLNKTEMSCLFDANGNVLETETEIAITALPKAVSDYTAKNYPGQNIKEASKIVDSKNGITYEAELKGVGDLIFDEKGNFIKKNAPEPKDVKDTKK